MRIASTIAVEQEAILFALFIFTRFWCTSTPAHAHLKPSSDIGLRHQLPK